MAADREAADLAFAAIVDRHGPIVRRVSHARSLTIRTIQDAFQATFSSGTKGSLGPPGDSVASWLHRVLTGFVFATAADARRQRRKRYRRNSCQIHGFGLETQATVRNWAT